MSDFYFNEPNLGLKLLCKSKIWHGKKCYKYSFWTDYEHINDGKFLLKNDIIYCMSKIS